MHSNYQKLSLLTAISWSSLMAPSMAASVSLLNEGFDNITTLTGAGWSIQNQSSPVGILTWFQGGADSTFGSYEGEPNSYIAANYNSTADAGTISNWLITPAFDSSNSITLSFYSRAIGLYADRLEVWLSTSGASTSTADFTTKILTINENLEVSGYPTSWTNYQETMSATGGSARFGFRYYVTDGGADGSHSNYFGIDSVSITSTAVPEPSSLLVVTGALAGSLLIRRRSATGKRPCLIHGLSL